MLCLTDAGVEAARLLCAETVGALGLKLLAGCRNGRVIAKFEHSLYVRFETGTCVCVGTQAIGAGPLNVLLARLDWLDLRTVPVGQPVAASDDAVSMGDGDRITLKHATIWRPRQTEARRQAVAPRLSALVPRAQRYVPEIGLGRLAFSLARGDADPLLTIARSGWNALERWLAHDMIQDIAPQAPEPSAGTLIGLGPGLTPSGDDVFCGVLIALESLGLHAARDALWSWLEPQLAQGTSEVSAAHLRAAAHGHGHAALHAVLECKGGDTIEREHALRELGKVGHCSGWDALAGVVLVWRAYAGHEAMSRAANSAA